ncbi:MAG: radical SAM protein, partial [Campylobacter sp.]|nr:radical SAM protein [Campylobacter sp.]
KLSKDGKEFKYDLQTDLNLHNEFAKSLLDSGKFELLELTKLARIGRDTYEYIRHTHKGTDILPLGNGAGGKIAGFGMFGMGGRKMISKNSPNQVKFEKLCNLFQYKSLNLSEFEILSNDIKTELFAFLKECEKMGFGEFKNGKFELNLNGVFWGNNIAVKSANIIKKEFIK